MNLGIELWVPLKEVALLCPKHLLHVGLIDWPPELSSFISHLLIVEIVDNDFLDQVLQLGESY